jgi:hypothetical protein
MTAVEFLENAINEAKLNNKIYGIEISKEFIPNIIKQAKEMEREQDKNKFSEEDMKEAFKNGAFKWRMHSGGKCFEEWFEQFKKK